MGMVRQAATRKFGLTSKRRKEHFQWALVAAFALEYGARNRGYCHLVVTSMAVVMFGNMCIHADASRLRWRDVEFERDGSSFHLSFEKRKNVQFRQGNRVHVVDATTGPVSPFKLLEILRLHTGESEDAYLFREFNGILVKKSPESTSPGNKCITYAQYSTNLSLWFGSVMGISPRSSSPSTVHSPAAEEEHQLLPMPVFLWSCGGSTATGSPHQRNVAT